MPIIKMKRTQVDSTPEIQWDFEKPVGNQRWLWISQKEPKVERRERTNNFYTHTSISLDYLKSFYYLCFFYRVSLETNRENKKQISISKYR
jgi:hypothetical protein